jgi:hypothetical protein
MCDLEKRRTNESRRNVTSLTYIFDRLCSCGLILCHEDIRFLKKKTFVNTYETARRHISESSNLQIKYGLRSDPFDILLPKTWEQCTWRYRRTFYKRTKNYIRLGAIFLESGVNSAGSLFFLDGNISASRSIKPSPPSPPNSIFYRKEKRETEHIIKSYKC